MEYRDIYFRSRDGLTLYARDYGSESAPTTILCMPGLTRNSADFDSLCRQLSPDYRLIATDQRGRGLSDYDNDSNNYQPLVYVLDMFSLLDQLQLERVVLLGTSLGGIMAMLMTDLQHKRIAGLIINDIGPEVDPTGLARIQGYVGKQRAVNSWTDAVTQCRELNSPELPNLSEQQWDTFSRAIYKENNLGLPVLAYDPNIATPLQSEEAGQSTAAPDLWPQFKGLTDKPLLLVRGAQSDILSIDCVDKMREIHPSMQYCEVPQRGHAPLLDEAESIDSIRKFLSSL